MADQKRWFKLWCSAPSDDDLLALPPALRWAWAAFGAYTKEHGTGGTVIIRESNTVLAAQMGVTVDALHSTLQLLPHLHIEERQNRHGEFTVTWDNWIKYQEDSTVRERAKRYRERKRHGLRGEERRGEERRDPDPDSHHQNDDGISESESEKLSDSASPAATPRLFNQEFGPSDSDKPPEAIKQPEPDREPDWVTAEREYRNNRSKPKPLEPEPQPDPLSAGGKFRVQEQLWFSAAQSLYRRDPKKYNSLWGVLTRCHQGGAPPEVIRDVTAGLETFGAEVENWVGWIEKTIKKRSEKYRRQKFEREHERIKSAETEFLGKLLGSIGKEI